MTNKRPELEDVRPCYSSDLEDTGNGKHEPPPSHKDANHPSLNYPLPPRPVVTGSMSHLNDDQPKQWFESILKLHVMNPPPVATLMVDCKKNFKP
ncbi:hypothetical protein HanIR_Chr01g0049821 [Helianthus annuus]|nr:hypothetical protein HanIR_Chr01g0049821 [Helianthus annuus]